MTIQCGWCGRHLSGEAATDDAPISHGICEPCAAEQYALIEAMKDERLAA